MAMGSLPGMRKTPQKPFFSVCRKSSSASSSVEDSEKSSLPSSCSSGFSLMSSSLPSSASHSPCFQPSVVGCCGVGAIRQTPMTGRGYVTEYMWEGGDEVHACCVRRCSATHVSSVVNHCIGRTSIFWSCQQSVTPCLSTLGLSSR